MMYSRVSFLDEIARLIREQTVNPDQKLILWLIAADHGVRGDEKRTHHETAKYDA